MWVFLTINVVHEIMIDFLNVVPGIKKPIIFDRLKIVPQTGIEPVLALRRTGF